MNAKELIAHVDESIAKALRHDSYIDEEILYLTGFSTGEQRRLVRNICEGLDTYLEVGLYGGATLCAAINNNPTLSAYGIENFSQDFDNKQIFKELKQNIAKYESHCKKLKIIDGDCFEIDLRSIRKPIDFYYYDGEHSQQIHAKALPHFLSKMNDTFLFMVDDVNWKQVKDGCDEGFEAIKHQINIEKFWYLKGEQPNDDPIWHNGVAIWCITRK